MSTSRQSISLLSSHVVWPLLAFIGITLILKLTHADLRIADWIYQRGHAWVLQDAWVTRELIHDGGRRLVSVMVLVVLLLFAGSWMLPAWRIWRRGLAYLLFSMLGAALLVYALKAVSHVECPWDLLRYGGGQAYADIFDVASWSSRSGACFPAGHASAGYAWFGLYYLAREYRPRWKWPVLGGILLLGFVFGAAQQLRGAHFFSHDWWTAGLCWFTATGCYWLFFPTRYAHNARQAR